MPKRRITACPVCDAPLEITELTCVSCKTRLAGQFPPPPLARLASEHQAFIETFLRCRGVIRDVERALGISYPTVRARLDAAVEALESVVAEEAADQDTKKRERLRKEILRHVEEGKLSPADAAAKLRHL